MKIIKGLLRLPERFARSLKAAGAGETGFGRLCVDLLLFPHDLQVVRGKYRYIFGRAPCLLKPRSFNEHITSNKLFGRSHVQIDLANKLSVRAYVSERIGEQYLTRLLWSGTDLDDVERASLPSKFVVKANHISGDVIVCRDASTFDWAAAARRARRWLPIDYSDACGEWQYRWIKPQLLIEEFLDDGTGEVPTDYKFFCFGGEVKFLQVDKDRFTGHRRAMLDREFRPLPFGFCYPRFTDQLAKPANFEQMLGLAEMLAKGLRFVRVDFYDARHPVFGEMTFHPDGGIGSFNPPEWDEALGQLFKHPQAKVRGLMP